MAEVKLDRTNLKRYMKKYGITERFLAHMIGVSEKTMCKKVEGESNFRWNEIDMIVHLFAALFGDNEYELCNDLFFQTKVVS